MTQIIGSPEFEVWFEQYERECHEEGALVSCKTEMHAAWCAGQASVLSAFYNMAIEDAAAIVKRASDQRWKEFKACSPAEMYLEIIALKRKETA